MERYKNKRVLVVGVGKTGFALINYFNKLNCDIRVTDCRPIFDLNKAVKRLKRIRPVPEMTFGEHKDEDFLDADIIVYSAAVNYQLPQLELARLHGKEVHSQFSLALSLCEIPILAVCGSYGRTTVAHMLGDCLEREGKKCFVGGTKDNPFINLFSLNSEEHYDYAIIEVSAVQLMGVTHFSPKVLVFTNIAETHDEKMFKSYTHFVESKLDILKNLSPDSYLIVNFDSLANNTVFKETKAQTYWYSRKSFVKTGVSGEVKGTHFHDKRIHSNIHYHSEFKVNQMRIVGLKNRENLLAAITAAKCLKVKDESIQECIKTFPGIPHRLEFVMEKNGVRFYNDSKSEKMKEMVSSLEAFKGSVILISGGKDTEQVYDGFNNEIEEKVRVLVLVGECKERMNRSVGEACQTYLVGSFEESILIAYQKSRTGDVILLSPGNDSTDTFRDYEERGNYFKKLVYQI